MFYSAGMQIGDSARATHEFDMSITRSEFERLLPLAAGTPVRMAGDRYRPAHDRPSWEIRLSALPDHRIGLLRVERLRVSVDLAALDPAARRAWLERFWRYFQRGGG